MKINNELGYRPVTFAELTDDEAFWNGCKSCINYDVLVRTNRKMCLCTGMLYDPELHKDDNILALNGAHEHVAQENEKVTSL